jgi:hypothetical protein
MAFDPLSSQGIQTAFECGKSLAQSISNKEAGKCISSSFSPALVPFLFVYLSCGGLQSFVQLVSQLQDEYKENKKFFYEQNNRFQTLFWERRREPQINQ